MTGCTDPNLMALRLGKAQNEWLIRCSDFGSAYCDAVVKYKEKLKEQEELNKERAELYAGLIVSALALCGGTIFTSVFGISASKDAAGELLKNKALSVATQKGWDRAKTAISWTDQNATAKFIMGKAWDKAEKKLDATLTSAFETLIRRASVPSSGANDRKYAQVAQNKMENMVREWSNSVNLAIQWAYQNLDDDDSVEEIFKTSPFFHPPKTSIDMPRMTDRIELSFWMNDVLQRDFLKTTTRSPNYFAGGVGVDRVTCKPIATDAWSKDYPSRPRDRSFTTGKRTEVFYQQVGDVIVKHINTLYAKVFGGPFFLPGTDLYGNITHETIRCAQTAIIQLADSNAVEIRKSLPV
ncbi:hypothetical protein ACSSV1_005261 [Labrenzia sp. MBR-25]